MRYFRRDLPQIVLLFILIGVWTGLSLLQFWPQAVLIDQVLNKAPIPPIGFYAVLLHLVPSGKAGQIIGLAVMTLAFALSKELVQMVRTLLAIRIGYDGLMQSRVDLFSKLQQLSIGYHRSQSQGDAIYRVSYDTYGVQQLFNVFVTIVVNALTLIVMTCIMLALNWQLTLCALAIAPFLLVTMKVWGKISGRAIDGGEGDRQRDDDVVAAIACCDRIGAGIWTGDGRICSVRSDRSHERENLAAIALARGALLARNRHHLRDRRGGHFRLWRLAGLSRSIPDVESGGNERWQIADLYRLFRHAVRSPPPTVHQRVQRGGCDGRV